jgi:hypothetical protein
MLSSLPLSKGGKQLKGIGRGALGHWKWDVLGGSTSHKLLIDLLIERIYNSISLEILSQEREEGVHFILGFPHMNRCSN